MSAVVCGKRPHFDELHGSPPISKRHRCGGSPARYTSGFSRSSSPGSPTSAPEVLQLRALFPEMDGELVEKMLESCGNNLDAAIKGLSDLRLSSEKPAQPSLVVPEQQTQQQQQQQHQHQQQPQQQHEGLDWVELFVSEMLSATDLDDARSRATRALQAFEKTIVAQSSNVVEALHKDNEQLKAQLEVLVNDNRILKRGVTIQHEKMVADNQEKEKLKQTLLQYQEQLKALELSNYALSVHLNRAQGNSSIPDHFHPDVF